MLVDALVAVDKSRATHFFLSFFGAPVGAHCSRKLLFFFFSVYKSTFFFSLFFFCFRYRFALFVVGINLSILRCISESQSNFASRKAQCFLFFFFYLSGDLLVIFTANSEQSSCVFSC